MFCIFKNILAALNVMGYEDSSSEEFFTSLHNKTNPNLQSRTNTIDKPRYLIIYIPRINFDVLYSQLSINFVFINYRRNISSLTRSVSEMNLKSSLKPIKKTKNRANDLFIKMKNNRVIGQQKNFKSKYMLYKFQ